MYLYIERSERWLLHIICISAHSLMNYARLGYRSLAEDGEDDDADGNGVGGEGRGSEEADDADQAEPAGLADEELQDAGERDAEQAEEDLGVEAEVAGEDV